MPEFKLHVPTQDLPLQIAKLGRAASPEGPFTSCRQGLLRALACNSQRYTSSRSSVDYDLEAFSHNPADGSFANSQVQMPNVRINGSSRTELNSYCDDTSSVG